MAMSSRSLSPQSKCATEQCHGSIFGLKALSWVQALYYQWDPNAETHTFLCQLVTSLEIVWMINLAFVRDELPGVNVSVNSLHLWNPTGGSDGYMAARRPPQLVTPHLLILRWWARRWMMRCKGSRQGGGQGSGKVGVLGGGHGGEEGGVGGLGGGHISQTASPTCHPYFLFLWIEERGKLYLRYVSS